MAALLGTDARIINWLRSLGIAEPEDTQRIIIDIPVADVVKVYVTRLADEKAFELVAFSTGDFEIVEISKPAVLTPKELAGMEAQSKRACST